VYRSAALLVGVMAGLSTLHGWATPVEGVQQEETVPRFERESLAGGEPAEVNERELAKGVDSGTPLSADTQGPGRELNLADFRWKNRIVLLFAPTPDDDVCASFRRAWEGLRTEVNARDLLLVEAYESGESRIGTTPLAGASVAQLRDRFKVASGAVVFVLIGKDGMEKLRKTTISMDELFGTIDAMPMRQREMREAERSGEIP
jgi:hypothetical protein